MIHLFPLLTLPTLNREPSGLAIAVPLTATRSEDRDIFRGEGGIFVRRGGEDDGI